MAMVRLVSGGMVRRSACGSTTASRVWPKLSPVERAASHWPLCTEVMPAQKISSEKAISTRASDSQVETKPDGDDHAGQDVRQVFQHHLAVEEGLGEAVPAAHGWGRATPVARLRLGQG